MRTILAIASAISLAVSPVPAASARAPHAKGKTVGGKIECRAAKCARAPAQKHCHETTASGGLNCSRPNGRSSDFGVSGPYIGLKFQNGS